MTDKADRQIAAARRLVAHLAQTLDADLSVRLWNGERLPLGSRVSDDLGFAINTPQALTRLVRRPRFATLVELLADGGIEIEGGTLIDIAHGAGRCARKVCSGGSTRCCSRATSRRSRSAPPRRAKVRRMQGPSRRRWKRGATTRR